ncbi:hypothetical protein QQS21_004242 [Conoideocrella luteorostrata]|uniref:Uncharacterized protein n=1 Tax=Conoideocrella luteorostrata TaxID=1105319 RepID=A0AAJ0CRU8_9HYPO|nr:hypothetical protein QQS21_004242 [Conoideocrella luteorostrata]
MDAYGRDHEALSKYMDTLPEDSIDVRSIEVFSASGQTNSSKIEQTSFNEFERLKKHLSSQLPTCVFCVCPSHEFLDNHRKIARETDTKMDDRSISALSGPLLRLLGHAYDMDYELWTSRFQSSDREWFAGPIMDRGSRQFSFFNLSFVDFRGSTAQTPLRFKMNRKLGHTTRLVCLFDPKHPESPDNVSVFVIRRISCYIRFDNPLWTILFFNDLHINMSGAHYEEKIPGQVQLPVASWIMDFLSNAQSQEPLIRDLSHDGFGLIARLLREIKNSWKLLLNELELEELDDDELIESAKWLHRKFLLNIDYFERQLLYHSRYINYLTSPPSQPDIAICPNTFKQDLIQEGDALRAVNQRLKALRTRTTATLETTVYGMQIAENQENKPWSLWSFAVLSIFLTALTFLSAMYRVEKVSASDYEDTIQAQPSGQWKVWVTLKNLFGGFRLVRVRVEQKPATELLV